MLIEKKILLLGSNAVGKTTTFKSITGELLDVSYRPSLSVNVGYKLFEVNGKQVGLRIWDLGGQLLHRQVWRNYYINTNGCFLIYDITRRRTFNDIISWKKEMSQFLKKKIPMILIGNKTDLESKREVNYNDGVSLAKKLKVNGFYETSALNKKDIQEVFEQMILKLL
ncbi:MAG: Rab family GTPase [Candidatus Helarchaeota archaeon]